MSRTYKDAPYELGGQRHKYAVGETHHAWFTRHCRRVARKLAKRALKKGEEPQPVYPVQRSYFD